MGLGRGFAHRVPELLCKVFFFHCGGVLLGGNGSGEDIVAVLLQGLLRGLVLHDGTAVHIEVVKVGIAEPVVDNHAQIKLVFSVFDNSEIDRQFHVEVVLVEFRMVGVLSDAKVGVQRHQLSF